MLFRSGTIPTGTPNSTDIVGLSIIRQTDFGYLIVLGQVSSYKPSVITGPVVDYTSNSVDVTYTIDSGLSGVGTKGIVYSLTPNPTLDNDYIEDGSGTGTSTVTIPSLSPGDYYYRAFAIAPFGTYYGYQKTFTI